MNARLIVKMMLGETGEPDQDYDHSVYDQIVQQVAAAGYPGGKHREFDKYSGVYITIPGVDKFWSVHDSGGWEFALMPDSSQEDQTTEIPVTVDWGQSKVLDTSDLIEYINQKYGAKFAQRKAQADAEDFIDTSFMAPKPARRSTRRAK